MAKVSQMYLDIDPFLIKETGYHKERHQVSESIFSLSNEYMGVRGFFDEGISIPHLVGTYFNGIIENSLEDTPSAYKGVVKRSHFTIDSVNFFKCRIKVGNDVLDLNKSSFSDFIRVLDMRTGLLTRSFVWKVKDKHIKLTFERILDMANCENAMQRISFEADKDVDVDIVLCLDGSILHWGNHCYWELESFIEHGIMMRTPTTHQSIAVKTSINHNIDRVVYKEKEIEEYFKLHLKAHEKVEVVRKIAATVNKDDDTRFMMLEGRANRLIRDLENVGFDDLTTANRAYFDKVWEKCDIEI